MEPENFYEFNECTPGNVHWFISQDKTFHYFFGDKDDNGRYDGETHYSELGQVEVVSIGDGTCLIKWTNNPIDNWIINENERMTGTLIFHHWRHGIHEYIGI